MTCLAWQTGKKVEPGLYRVPIVTQLFIKAPLLVPKAPLLTPRLFVLRRDFNLTVKTLIEYNQNRLIHLSAQSDANSNSATASGVCNLINKPLELNTHPDLNSVSLPFFTSHTMVITIN